MYVSELFCLIKIDRYNTTKSTQRYVAESILARILAKYFNIRRKMNSGGKQYLILDDNGTNHQY